MAACATTQSGIAQPVRTARGTTVPTTAPSVPKPLSIANWIRNPCSLFTSAQLRALGLTASATSKTDENAVMNGCEWNDPTVGDGLQIDVEAETALSHGLTDIYAQQRSAAYWQPIDVGGYPAVLTDTFDERSSGTCRMALGVTDTSVLDLSYQGAASPDPCARVRVLGTAVITSLKERT